MVDILLLSFSLWRARARDRVPVKLNETSVIRDGMPLSSGHRLYVVINRINNPAIILSRPPIGYGVARR